MKTEDISEVRHQQLRIEIAGWAAVIIALQLYQQEVLMKALTHTIPSAGNLVLLTLAVVCVIVCLVTSLRLRWRQLLLTAPALLLISCSAAGGYSKTNPDGSQVKLYAQAKIGTDTSGERQSADLYAAAITNQSTATKATAKTAVTQAALRAAVPVLSPVAKGVGNLIGQ